MATRTREQVYRSLHGTIHSGALTPIEEKILCSFLSCMSSPDWDEEQAAHTDHHFEVAGVVVRLLSDQTCIRCGDQAIIRTLEWNRRGNDADPSGNDAA